MLDVYGGAVVLPEQKYNLQKIIVTAHTCFIKSLLTDSNRMLIPNFFGRLQVQL